MPSKSDITLNCTGSNSGIDDKLRTRDLTGSFPPASVILEDFDDGRFVLNPQESGELQYHIRGHDTHSLVDVTLNSDTVKSDGTYSLKVEHEPFNTIGGIVASRGDANIGRVWINTNDKTGSSDAEYYQHQMTKYARENGEERTSDSWPKGVYNRIRFWIKLSPNITYQPVPNFQCIDIGGYNRATWGDLSSQEEGGWHYYHKFNAFHNTEGKWHQCIMDTHVQTIREAGSHPNTSPIGSGTITQDRNNVLQQVNRRFPDGTILNSNGNGEYTDGTPGFNGEEVTYNGVTYPAWESDVADLTYYDTFTSFYIDYGYRADHNHGIGGNDANDPTDIDTSIENWMMIDNLEFYYEPNESHLDTKISSMNGVYTPGNNELYVAWLGNRIVVDESANCEASWSFTSMKDPGRDFSDGTLFTSSQGSFTNGSQRDMRVECDDLVMGSNDVIYVAVRVVGDSDTDFRQISIPLTDAGYDIVADEKQN